MRRIMCFVALYALTAAFHVPVSGLAQAPSLTIEEPKAGTTVWIGQRVRWVIRVYGFPARGPATGDYLSLRLQGERWDEPVPIIRDFYVPLTEFSFIWVDRTRGIADVTGEWQVPVTLGEHRLTEGKYRIRASVWVENRPWAWAEQTIQISPPDGQANLEITKTDSPDPMIAGQTLTYTLVVTNAGPSDAHSVVVTETYPAGFVFSSATPPPDVGTNNRWTFTMLPAGKSEIITITGVVSPEVSGTLMNSVSVTSATADPDLKNNTVTIDTTVEPPRPVEAKRELRGFCTETVRDVVVLPGFHLWVRITVRVRQTVPAVSVWEKFPNWRFKYEEHLSGRFENETRVSGKDDVQILVQEEEPKEGVRRVHWFVRPFGGGLSPGMEIRIVYRLEAPSDAPLKLFSIEGGLKTVTGAGPQIVSFAIGPSEFEVVKALPVPVVIALISPTDLRPVPPGFDVDVCEHYKITEEELNMAVSFLNRPVPYTLKVLSTDYLLLIQWYYVTQRPVVACP